MKMTFKSILLKNLIYSAVLIISIPLIFIFITAFFFRSFPFFIVIYFFLIFGIIISWKYLFRSFQLNVTLIDDGFYLEERNLKIRWVDIKRFGDNSTKGSLFPSIVLKLKSGKNINIIYFKYKKDKNDSIDNWENFSKIFFKDLKEKNPEVMNYYDSKNWNILIYVLYVLNITVPIAMLVIKVKPLQFMATWLTLSGFSIIMISAIRNNRSNAKTYKTYKEIQEEKQLNINKRE